MSSAFPSNLSGGRIGNSPLATTLSVADATIEIVAARLDVEPDAVYALAALLSGAEREKASRFAFGRDRRRFTVARGLLRQLLAARLSTRPESVELTYGLQGKPRLAQPFADSGLRFNVSHDQDVAVYAFSRGREIGIDVETVRALPDAGDIAARFFSRRENETYRALDWRDRELGFFNCWTRKEAFIKCIGDGFSYPLDRFDVTLTPGEPAKLLSVEGRSGDSCGWALDSFQPGPGLVAAVARRKFPDGSD